MPRQAGWDGHPVAGREDDLGAGVLPQWGPRGAGEGTPAAGAREQWAEGAGLKSEAEQWAEGPEGQLVPHTATKAP